MLVFLGIRVTALGEERYIWVEVRWEKCGVGFKLETND